MKAYLRLENIRNKLCTVTLGQQILKFSSSLPTVTYSTYSLDNVTHLQGFRDHLYAIKSLQSSILVLYYVHIPFTHVLPGTAGVCSHSFLSYWLLLVHTPRGQGLDFHTESGSVLSVNKFMSQSQIYISAHPVFLAV